MTGCQDHEESRGERGAATPYTLLLLGFVLIAALASVAAAGMVISHRRAQAGADLSALAGARAAQDGAAPCGAAARIAQRNRVELTGCRVDGFEVRVVVAARPLVLPGGAVTMRARARAGPVSLLPG